MKTIASLLSQLLFLLSVLCLTAAFTIGENKIESFQEQQRQMTGKNVGIYSMQNKQRKNTKQQSGKRQPLKIQNMTVYDEELRGNMLIIGNYALIPQNTDDGCPTILRLNLISMKEQVFKYPQEEKGGIYMLVLADFQNGDLGFGIGYIIYILDRQTLALKQRLHSIYSIQSVLAFNAFIDSKLNQKRILVYRGDSFRTEIVCDLKIDKQGKYVESFAFFYSLGSYFNNLAFDLHLNQTSKGVQLISSYLVYWQSLSEGLAFSNDPKYQLLNKTPVATSYSSDFFVVTQISDESSPIKSLSFQIFDLDDNNQISLRRIFNISQNQLFKAEFISNDQQLFLSAANKQQNKRSLIKVAMNGNTILHANSNDGLQENIVDFNLFDAESDRMIVLVERESAYFLQLRSIGTLKIIHEINIELKTEVLDYKLVGNIKWGFTFAVAVKLDAGYHAENCLLYQYKVQGDKIKSTSLESLVIGFQTVTSCNKYVITYNPRESNQVRIYHFSNFKIATQIDVGKYRRIIVDKNFFAIFGQRLFMFDFSQSLQSFGTFFTSNTDLTNIITFLLPKRGIIYQVANRMKDQHIFTRMIYNISRPQVKTMLLYQNQTYTCERIYFEAKKGIIYRQVEAECNKVYYIAYQYYKWEKPKLAEYDECSKQKKYFPIEYSSPFECNTIRMMTSSDGKYLIFAIQKKMIEILVEVRLLEDLGSIVFRQIYEIPQLFRQFATMKYLFADVLNDSTLLLKSINFVLSATLNNQKNFSIVMN